MTGPEGVRLLGPLTEWTSRVYEGVALTPDDRAVVDKWSASGDDRLQIELDPVGQREVTVFILV